MKAKKKGLTMQRLGVGATGPYESDGLTSSQMVKLAELLGLSVMNPLVGAGELVDMAKRRFSDNFNPTGDYSKGYEDLLDQFLNAVLYNEPQLGSYANPFEVSNDVNTEASDLLELLLFNKQRYNSLPVSEYSPTITASSEGGALGDILSGMFSVDPVYYSSPSTEEELRRLLSTSPNRIFGYNDEAWLDEPKIIDNLLLGDYTVSTGKDDKGTYLSYYDEWDLNPLAQISQKLKPLEDALYSPFFTPAEVYGRVYYDPKEINLGSTYTPRFRVKKKIKTDET